MSWSSVGCKKLAWRHRDESMKAVYFTQHGGPEVLIYGDLPEPQAQRGEVVIRVRASSMNYNDIWARQGMPRLPVPLPHISGTDAAGVVVEVGEGVHNVKVGDEVMAHVLQSCRVCPSCLAGEELFCRAMQVWGFQTGPLIGGYAQYARLQAFAMHPQAGPPVVDGCRRHPGCAGVGVAHDGHARQGAAG